MIEYDFLFLHVYFCMCSEWNDATRGCMSDIDIYDNRK